MDDSKGIEALNVQIGLAEETDLAAILRLQNENLGRNVLPEGKITRGYVSVETPLEQLREIGLEDGVTTAKLDGRLVGYVIPLTLEQASKIELLEPFIKRFDALSYEDKPLNQYRYCIVGQICVDKEYGRRGISEKLYSSFAHRMAEHYDLGVTEVAADNATSMRTHEKAGFQVLEQYEAENRQWNVLLIDFRRYKSKNGA